MKDERWMMKDERWMKDEDLLYIGDKIYDQDLLYVDDKMKVIKIYCMLMIRWKMKDEWWKMKERWMKDEDLLYIGDKDLWSRFIVCWW
jgi:hypothetical protein